VLSERFRSARPRKQETPGHGGEPTAPWSSRRSRGTGRTGRGVGAGLLSFSHRGRARQSLRLPDQFTRAQGVPPRQVARHDVPLVRRRRLRRPRGLGGLRPLRGAFPSGERMWWDDTSPQWIAAVSGTRSGPRHRRAGHHLPPLHRHRRRRRPALDDLARDRVMTGIQFFEAHMDDGRCSSRRCTPSPTDAVPPPGDGLSAAGARPRRRPGRGGRGR
jgi:hypothetical protein